MQNARVNVAKHNNLLAATEVISKLRSTYSTKAHNLASVKCIEQRADGSMVVQWRFDGDFDTFDQDAFLSKLRSAAAGNPVGAVRFERGSVVAAVMASPPAIVLIMMAAGVGGAAAMQGFAHDDGTLAAVCIGGATAGSLAVAAGVAAGTAGWALVLGGAFAGVLHYWMPRR